MFRGGAGRALTLFIVALAVEQMTRSLRPGVWFLVVFSAVFFADNFRRLSGGSDRPLFLEDIVLGLLLYAGFGYLSSLLDLMLSAYTGRHASPASPAVILALLDKSWPAENLSSKRR